MNSRQVLGELESLADHPGLMACVIVDIDTGMVWHAAGLPDLVPLAEAASDYWRLGRRQPAFEPLGPTRAQVSIHDRARLTLATCGPGLLLVTVSREPDAVDWARWKRGVARLQALAAAP